MRSTLDGMVIVPNVLKAVVNCHCGILFACFKTVRAKCLFIYSCSFLLVSQVSVPNVWFSGGWVVYQVSINGPYWLAYGSIFREGEQSFLASLNLR